MADQKFEKRRLRFPLTIDQQGWRNWNRPEGKGLVEVEMFWDFSCPFSAKMCRATLSAGLLEKYPDINFVVYPVVQPWHVGSVYTTETLLALKLVNPWTCASLICHSAGNNPNTDDRTAWAMARALSDDKIYDKSRRECYNLLLNGFESLADDKEEMRAWLTPPAEAKKEGICMPAPAPLYGADPNDKSAPISYLYKQTVRYHRKRAVHVTPTVFVNGVEQGQISSSWTTQQWEEFLDESLSAAHAWKQHEAEQMEKLMNDA